jgi:hypothetical protein
MLAIDHVKTGFAKAEIKHNIHEQKLFIPVTILINQLRYM